jgi:hypothetical protein
MNCLPKHTHLPEDIDDPVILKEHIFSVVEGDDYWHDRIKCALATAGFITTRLQREPEHPVWLAWLTRTTFDLSPDRKTAIRQLRKILRDGNISVVRDQFNIIDRRGDKLRCVFLLEKGAPGIA